MPILYLTLSILIDRTGLRFAERTDSAFLPIERSYKEVLSSSNYPVIPLWCSARCSTVVSSCSNSALFPSPKRRSYACRDVGASEVWSCSPTPSSVYLLSFSLRCFPTSFDRPSLICKKPLLLVQTHNTNAHTHSHPHINTHARTHTNRHTAAELQRKQQRPQLCLTALALGVGDQPLKGDVDIVLLFARDTVAADFPVLYAGEVPVERRGVEDRFMLVKRIFVAKSAGTDLLSFSSFLTIALIFFTNIHFLDLWEILLEVFVFFRPKRLNWDKACFKV